MLKTRFLRSVCVVAAVVAVGVAVFLPASLAAAACTVESSPAGKPGPLMVHLGADCTGSDREANAVKAAAILKTIAQGQAVDLVGVVVQGDLIVDQLPLYQSQVPKGLTPEQQAALNSIEADELRVIQGPITIRDSIVEGALRHQSAKGTVQFAGPVDLQGTQFKDGVDLSRAVFQGVVTIDRAVFERESYFIRGQFAEAFHCVDTRFGPHTRFHRSVFRGAVDCQGSLFNGMAEFLEVVFEQPVQFDRARFGLGTGFSGAQFKKTVSFADAIFSREAFFGFAVFAGNVQFAGAQFLQTADFSNAEFKRGEDLAKVRFDQAPTMTGAKGVSPEGQGKGGQSPAMQYGVTLFFLLMAAVLVAYALKLK
jgi:uncharacterized protein YjbI with pentapeptide repeats